MTLLLTTLAFGSASCAYILHEVRKAPRGIEMGGKFFICTEPNPAREYRAAGDATLASVRM